MIILFDVQARFRLNKHFCCQIRRLNLGQVSVVINFQRATVLFRFPWSISWLFTCSEYLCTPPLCPLVWCYSIKEIEVYLLCEILISKNTLQGQKTVVSLLKSEYLRRFIRKIFRLNETVGWLEKCHSMFPRNTGRSALIAQILWETKNRCLRVNELTRDKSRGWKFACH